MNSEPGRLTGSHIRPLPPALVARFRVDAPNRRVKSARYRVTGFRGEDGSWIARVRVGKHKGRDTWGYRIAGSRKAYRPSDDVLARSALISVEIEIDRGRGPRLYYTTLQNPRRG